MNCLRDIMIKDSKASMLTSSWNQTGTASTGKRSWSNQPAICTPQMTTSSPSRGWISILFQIDRYSQRWTTTIFPTTQSKMFRAICNSTSAMKKSILTSQFYARPTGKSCTISSIVSKKTRKWICTISCGNIKVTRMEMRPSRYIAKRRRMENAR